MWPQVTGAAGYHIYLNDGSGTYRQVGATLGGGAISGRLRGSAFYPGDTEIAGSVELPPMPSTGPPRPTDGYSHLSGDSTPSTLQATVTPSPAPSPTASPGSGVVVADGTYLYVHAWARLRRTDQLDQDRTGNGRHALGYNYGTVGPEPRPSAASRARLSSGRLPLQRLRHLGLRRVPPSTASRPPTAAPTHLPQRRSGAPEPRAPAPRSAPPRRTCFWPVPPTARARPTSTRWPTPSRPTQATAARASTATASWTTTPRATSSATTRSACPPVARSDLRGAGRRQLPLPDRLARTNGTNGPTSPRSRPRPGRSSTSGPSTRPQTEAINGCYDPTNDCFWLGARSTRTASTSTPAAAARPTSQHPALICATTPTRSTR